MNFKRFSIFIDSNWLTGPVIGKEVRNYSDSYSETEYYFLFLTFCVGFKNGKRQTI